MQWEHLDLGFMEKRAVDRPTDLWLLGIFILYIGNELSSWLGCSRSAAALSLFLLLPYSRPGLVLSSSCLFGKVPGSRWAGLLCSTFWSLLLLGLQVHEAGEWQLYWQTEASVWYAVFYFLATEAVRRCISTGDHFNLPQEGMRLPYSNISSEGGGELPAAGAMPRTVTDGLVSHPI
jgi:hypothetical protein